MSSSKNSPNSASSAPRYLEGLSLNTRWARLGIGLSLLPSQVGLSYKIPVSTTLSSLLCLCRHISILYQTFHWQASGPTSQSDHELFGRLYEETNDEIDDIGEKLVGLEGNSSVDFGHQMSLLTRVPSLTPPPIITPAEWALALETKILDLLGTPRVGTTPGIDNLLDGIADMHEKHVYLLKQRVGVGVLP